MSASTADAEDSAESPVQAALTRARAALSTLLRLPFTVGLWLLVLVLGLVTGSLWSHSTQKSWYVDVAFGLPALQEGKWWTIVTSTVFEPSPGKYLVALILIPIGIGWAETRLGTARVATVAIAGKIGAELLAVLFVWVFSGGLFSWDWADRMAQSRGTGVLTMVVAAVAVASATLRSPWRLRVRALLSAVVAIVFLFEGTFGTIQYVLATVILIPVGETWFSTTERGYLPRTRREVRMLASVGVLVIAATDLLVFFFPSSGPLGPSDSEGESATGLLVAVVINVLIANALRHGRRWAWWVAVVLGVLNVGITVLGLALIWFTDFDTQGNVTVGTTLLWAVLLAIVIPGRFAFRVRWRVKQSGDPGSDPVAQVKDLLHTHGGGTMSWMITWPGNRYLFTDGGRGVVAYQKHMGTLLALADPVCAPDDLRDAVRTFVDAAEQSGRTPCWFSVGAETAHLAEQLGWRSLQIAEDTIVDLPELEFKGKPWQNVRSAINKSTKEGITFRLVTLADESFAIRSQVRAISEEWVGDKGLPEMGFTLGTVDEAMDPEVRVALALDGGGSVHGVLSWLPVYDPTPDDAPNSAPVVRGWTLDVMRRRTDGFGPVIEYLIASSALAFKEEGAQFISLSGAPLAHGDDNVDLERMDRLLDSLGAAMEPFYGFRSLHHFKKKFNPRYEPVYLSFRDESDLPRIGLAISRAYLPDASPSQLVRLAASGKGE
ncbi:bifunctional lysylphosphatidylglycerol flippase/synthetase MprF [Gordonia sp. NPDC003424]